MEYLKKQKNPPIGWDQLWMLNDGITLASDYAEFEYAPNNGAKSAILRILLSEQNGLCFYCQNDNVGSFTIEHLIPQSDSPELSLNYHNLTAVCWSCNNIRSNYPIPFLGFHISQLQNYSSNFPIHRFFYAFANGIFEPNPLLKKNIYDSGNGISEYQMVESYIAAVGLNRDDLVKARKLYYFNVVGNGVPISASKEEIKKYLKNKFNILLTNSPIKFRLFLLLALASKIQKL